MQFSIRELLIVVTIIAIGCAALTFASDGWRIAVDTITFFIVMTAGVVAIVGTDARRVFAIGFLVFGCGYFGVLWLQNTWHDIPTEFDARARLPSSKLLLTWYNAIAVPTESDDPMALFGAGGGFAPAMPATRTVISPPIDTFMHIGHTLVMLMLGYLGGHFARFVYLRRMRETTPPAAT